MPHDPCIALLRELIAIDSVNPSLVAGAAGEGAIASAIAAHMRRIGMDVQIQEVAPGRPNVIGTIEGRGKGPSILLCGHMDTVGVDGMTAPFHPQQDGERLYGRGAQDMKAGLAAMIDAVRVALERGFSTGRLVVAAVIDEEYASLGADALVTEWTADFAIVTEPTNLKIGVAHKGFAWMEVETTGRAAHGSRPHEGRDAILMMGRVLEGLEALDRELQSRAPHPLMGTASLHASVISGGQELSSYPARCVLQLERRTVAGESGHEAHNDVVRLLDTLAGADEDFHAESRLTFARPAYEVPAGHPLPDHLGELMASRGLPAEKVGMSFWTDAAVLGAAGMPTVLFGPGGAGLHGPEEYVNIGDVTACRDVLALLALSSSGVR